MQRFSRRAFLRTTLAGSAALALGLRTSSKGARRVAKPNLLVFLPDELRADAVFGNSAAAVHAPNIHKLAGDSFVFERVYVTQPICSPSRSSLLSGTWPHQTGCTNNKSVLPLNVLALPQMLSDSDYRTGYFGKWHLGDEFSAQRGFQEWVSIEDSFKAVERGHKTAGTSDYTRFLLAKGCKPDRNRKLFSLEFPARLPFELSKAKFLETKACQFLERHRNDNFILFVAFLEPHPPYDGPFNNEHSAENVPIDSTVSTVLTDDHPLRSRLLQEYYRNEIGAAEDYRSVKQRYFGLITEIDRSIGTILTRLDDLGLTDRTITVLTSDHGDMMGAHGILGKQLMFDASASVPLVIRGPGKARGRYSRPISHIDFVPTILDLCGQPRHGQCAGRSKAGLLRGQTVPAAPVFLQWSPGKDAPPIKTSALATKQEIQDCLRESTRTVVSPDGWKLSLRDHDKNELYDLRHDPEERNNLYYNAGHRDTIAVLTREIHRWQRGLRDRLRV